MCGKASVQFEKNEQINKICQDCDYILMEKVGAYVYVTCEDSLKTLHDLSQGRELEEEAC